MNKQTNAVLHTDVPLDKELFAKLFHKYYESLCFYAYGIIHNEETAEEIVEGMFVKLWEERNNIRIETSLNAYFYKSVHNACLNYIEHTRIKNRYSDVYLKEYKDLISPVSPDYPTANLLTQELDEIISRAIFELPDQCREIFLKVRHEEMTYAQVADKLGISVNTVKTQLQRAVARLRVSLKDYL